MSGYVLGIAAAIAAGITFNLGLVIQKVAVARIRQKDGLMKNLVRSPVWLVGFGVQFLLGMPLNMLAQANIGPTLAPGLMSIGLVVLALGAVWLANEKLGLLDGAGIVLVIVATALFGVSRLSVEMKTVDLYGAGILTRMAVLSTAVAALSLACHTLQRRGGGLCAVFRTTNAGLMSVQSVLWLGIMMGFLGRWSQGQFVLLDLIPALVASAITFSGSMLCIVETQRAFQLGDAARLVPIQSVPVQILPLASYFFVFRAIPPGLSSLLMAGSGAALILAGSALLARRQAALS